MSKRTRNIFARFSKSVTGAVPLTRDELVLLIGVARGVQLTGRQDDLRQSLAIMESATQKLTAALDGMPVGEVAAPSVKPPAAASSGRTDAA